jgi:CO/xanthine dehydrogenase Mo-binding subunit
MSETKTVSVGQIGRSLPRVEARAKVTGRAEYVHNLRLPGMLWAKIARSTVPHGRIRHIDTSAAQATHGVYSVVTGEDILRVIPDPYFGPAFHDQPILALGKVRFAGEPVAVVLAEDPKIAEAAAQEISIDYEELPAVLDEVEALIATTFVHEALKPAGNGRASDGRPYRSSDTAEPRRKGCATCSPTSAPRAHAAPRRSSRPSACWTTDRTAPFRLPSR